MAVTLEDIATATGFDKSTISLTLRNLPRANRFSQETRDRIRAVAAEMGYRPNFFAQQLSGRKPRMLMLCVNFLRDPFAMRVAEGFEARASELGLRVLITALRDRQEPLELLRDVLGVQGVPAIALIGSDATKLPDAALLELARNEVKVVLVNRVVPGGAGGTAGGIGHVGADELRGGRLIGDHVYGQGVTDVWAVAGMPGRVMEQRLAGFAAAAAARGLPPPRLLNCQPLERLDWAGGVATTLSAALAVAARPPQAILTVSDVMAVGAGRALAEAGLVVGRDVAVTGYDDAVYAQCAWPPMTTVRLPMDDMGRAAVDALIGMLDAPDDAPPTITLPVELMVRESGRYAPTATPR